MRKTPTIVAAMALSLSAAACTVGDPTPPAGGVPGPPEDDIRVGYLGEESADTAAESAPGETTDNPVCDEFLGGPTPLATLADEGRQALAEEVLDPAAYGEITLLQQRLEVLTEEASAEQAALIETVNQPFVQAVEAVQTGDALDVGTGEITVPEIDVEASTIAQDELETLCQG